MSNALEGDSGYCRPRQVSTFRGCCRSRNPRMAANGRFEAADRNRSCKALLKSISITAGRAASVEGTLEFGVRRMKFRDCGFSGARDRTLGCSTRQSGCRMSDHILTGAELRSELSSRLGNRPPSSMDWRRAVAHWHARPTGDTRTVQPASPTSRMSHRVASDAATPSRRNVPPFMPTWAPIAGSTSAHRRPRPRRYEEGFLTCTSRTAPCTACVTLLRHSRHAR
jgi:hypothetical protein